MHAHLKVLARTRRQSVSALMRRAVEEIYGVRVDELIRTLSAIEGLWRDRTDLGSTYAYVRRLRRDTHRLRGRKRRD
jgi:chromosome segregation and condensation protein ScpB